MEIHYTETNGYPETVVTVYEKDDLYKVADALELISELLCVKVVPRRQKVLQSLFRTRKR